MEEPDIDDPWFGPGPMLKESWSNIFGEILTAVRDVGELETCMQLENVMVPLQNIKGSEREFSFMAYPVPRLTREQREKMEVRDFRSITVRLRAGRIQIGFDVFEQINWLSVSDIPELYLDLKRSLVEFQRE